MNRYLLFLLISMISLDVSAKNPFDDISDANYIELQEMSPVTHIPAFNDHPNVNYHSLYASASHIPENDLHGSTPSQSTIQYHKVINAPLDGHGWLLLLKACLPCIFTPEYPNPSNLSDSL